MFGTVDEAKEVLQKSEALDKVELDLKDGNIENVLITIKEGNREIFNKVVDDYLSVLEKVDANSYYHVAGNVAKSLIMNMARSARSTKNKQLEAAAQLVNQFVFESDEFTPPTKLGKDKPDNKERDDLAEEKAAFVREKFETAHIDLSTKVGNTIRATVDANIDKTGQMTTFVKKHAIQEVVNNLDEVMAQDAGLMKVMKGLWEKAEKTKFSSSSMQQIRSVYLSRAKTLLPTIIKNSRREALKGMGKKISKRVDKDDEEPRRRTGKKPSNKTTHDGRGMTTLEFLNS